MKPKRHVYRQYDQVTIVEPILVIRVGYSLTPQLAYPIVAKALSADIRVLRDKLRVLAGLKPEGDCEWIAASEDKDPLIWRLAYDYVRFMGFGGPERSLHTEVREELRGKVARVVSKRVVKTGTRYNATGGYDSWTGEYDYEPGGLNKAKTHVLLKVEVPRDPVPGQLCSLYDEVEIEACHVTPFIDPILADSP